MVDVWPNEPFSLSPERLAEPLVDLIFGLSIAVAGALLLSRFFPGSWMERKLVLSTAAGGDSQTLRAERASQLPQPGAQGIAVTDLFPSGRVEIDGQRYDARSALGSIDRGAQVQVVQTSAFSLIVEAPGNATLPSCTTHGTAANTEIRAARDRNSPELPPSAPPTAANTEIRDPVNTPPPSETTSNPTSQEASK
ncbi:NfeD family protein [Coraliomargarita algicola]|uniref:NfeD family protein n=1 Tax=Coraliomargarita algicola TaxID=3092156 RepID=A0ABZ0RFC4_9BACT|nr:NfeD family protein [Coraliomargarita sp. J2-16]WPJ94257.1 NfeD family protein [Coraliomargarita sp. J2-16]